MIRREAPHPFGAAVATRRRCLAPVVLGSNQRVLINTSRTTNKYGPNRGHIYLAVVRVYYEIVSGIFPDIGKNTGNFAHFQRKITRPPLRC